MPATRYTRSSIMEHAGVAAAHGELLPLLQAAGDEAGLKAAENLVCGDSVGGHRGKIRMARPGAMLR